MAENTRKKGYEQHSIDQTKLWNKQDVQNARKAEESKIKQTYLDPEIATIPAHPYKEIQDSYIDSLNKEADEHEYNRRKMEDGTPEVLGAFWNCSTPGL